MFKKEQSFWPESILLAPADQHQGQVGSGNFAKPTDPFLKPIYIKKDLCTMKTVSRYALAYVLWVVSIVVGSVVIYFARQAIVDSIALSSLSSLNAGNQAFAFYRGLQLRSSDAFSYLIMGLVLLIMIVFVEFYFRSGVPSGRVTRRFMLVTVVEIGVLFASHATYFILANINGVVGWSSALVPGLELAALALCVVLFVWLRRRPILALPLHVIY